MHELILLRHAEAQPSQAGADDHHRRLSGRGEQEAKAAGNWLASHGVKPDRVLCSPSERTRSTRP
jgi:phosphohistidine phosphatase